MTKLPDEFQERSLGKEYAMQRYRPQDLQRDHLQKARGWAEKGEWADRGAGALTPPRGEPWLPLQACVDLQQLNLDLPWASWAGCGQEGGTLPLAGRRPQCLCHCAPCGQLASSRISCWHDLRGSAVVCVDLRSSRSWRDCPTLERKLWFLVFYLFSLVWLKEATWQYALAGLLCANWCPGSTYLRMFINNTPSCQVKNLGKNACTLILNHILEVWGHASDFLTRGNGKTGLNSYSCFLSLTLASIAYKMRWGSEWFIAVDSTGKSGMSLKSCTKACFRCQYSMNICCESLDRWSKKL